MANQTERVLNIVKVTEIMKIVELLGKIITNLLEDQLVLRNPLETISVVLEASLHTVPNDRIAVHPKKYLVAHTTLEEKVEAEVTQKPVKVLPPIVKMETNQSTVLRMIREKTLQIDREEGREVEIVTTKSGNITTNPMADVPALDGYSQ